MASNTPNLFADFQPPDQATWEAALEKALKGKSAEALEWNAQGFKMPAFVRDARKRPQGVRTAAGWKITEAVSLQSGPEAANKHGLEALWKGAEAIRVNGQPTSREALNTLLHEILVEIIPLSFRASNPLDLAQWLELERQSRGLERNAIHANLGFDPLGQATFAGNWFASREEDFELGKRAIRTLNEQLPSCRAITVHANHFHSAGAGPVLELALTLAQGSEYLAALASSKQPADAVANQLAFSVACGNSYFAEIAKLRALRILWPEIVRTYGGGKELTEMQLHASTSRFTLSVYDAWNNMLRATSHSMAAIVGGCNNLEVVGYNEAFEAESSFGQRVARNLQHVLREEAWLDKVADPAGGSRYIESLTHEIAGNALAQFKEIEARGGYLQCLTDGYIQQLIAADAHAMQAAVESGELVVIGVNKYANAAEKMADKYQAPASAFAPATSTAFEPVPLVRATQTYESKRLKSEASTKNTATA